MVRGQDWRQKAVFHQPNSSLSENFVPRRDATIGSCQEFSVDIKEVIEEILADTNMARDRAVVVEVGI